MITDTVIRNEITQEDVTYKISTTNTDVSTANNQGYVTLTWYDGSSVNHTVTSGQTIAKLYFSAVADIEKCDTNLSFAAPDQKTNIIGYYDTQNQNYAISDSAVDTVAVPGAIPTLKEVTLAQNTVNVAGGDADVQTVQATATSAKGTDITSKVAWLSLIHISWEGACFGSAMQVW